MRWFLVFILVFSLLLPAFACAQYIIADHNAVQEFDSIPDYWLEKAKEITIHYGHTSHGFQINSGLQYLETYVDSTKYSFARRSNAITAGLPPLEDPPALREYDGNPNETYIAYNDYWDGESAMDRTRAVVSTGDYNISLYSWCGEQSSNSVTTVQRYLDNMATLDSEYPDTTFILMTGHTDGTQGSVACDENNLPSGCSRLRRNNEMVVDYANLNDMVVFDFADIESWDPDGNHYPDTTDACAWCSTWCTNHPEDCQNLPNCAHSHGFNCVQKGKAFWWAMARIAGWEGGSEPPPPQDEFFVDVDSIGGSCSDSNPGTITAPWCTISQANSDLEPGDTVFIREGTYSESITPSNNGTQDSYITYTNYLGETPTITNVNIAIGLGNKEYIKINGITLDGQQVYPNANINEWVRMSNANYNIIQNCVMRYVNGWNGISTSAGSHHNKIINNTLSYCGEPQPPAAEDMGDLILIRSSYNLIEGNDISYGGHNLLNIYDGDHNIIRYNNFHNQWGRNIALKYRSLGDPSNQYNVIEHNKITYSTHYHDNIRPNSGLQNSQHHAIIRFNEFYDNYGNGLSINHNELGEAVDNKIYHNVFYHNGFNDRDIDSAAIIINDWADGNENFCCNAIKNNILYDNALPGIYFDNGDPSYHYIENNLQENPYFVAQYDFRLQQNSSAVDAGTWLTHTLSAGSGTQIQVEDASYFTDGFNLIEGDLIQMEGQAQTARITNIDYTTHTITVDTSLTWIQNQGVSLAYQGNAPDAGVYESEYTASHMEGDIDGDNDVDLEDLILVAIDFGKKTNFLYSADTNRDGVIDIFDMVYVARRIT